MNFVVDPFASKIQIPWMLEGAFVVSLVLAHVQAAYLHHCTCRKWRLLTALTGEGIGSLFFDIFLHVPDFSSCFCGSCLGHVAYTYIYIYLYNILEYYIK